MITETIITPALSKLFIGYAKVVILPEIRCWIQDRLKLIGEVTSSQQCYGDLNEHSWQTLKFYIKAIETLFSINIGVDSGRNEENFGQDVIFVEANIYINDIGGSVIYAESNNIERWELMLNEFYQELTQYFNRNFNQ